MSEYERNISAYNLEKDKKDRISDSVIWIVVGVDLLLYAFIKLI